MILNLYSRIVSLQELKSEAATKQLLLQKLIELQEADQINSSQKQWLTHFPGLLWLLISVDIKGYVPTVQFRLLSNCLCFREALELMAQPIVECMDECFGFITISLPHQKQNITLISETLDELVKTGNDWRRTTLKYDQQLIST